MTRRWNRDCSRCSSRSWWRPLVVAKPRVKPPGEKPHVGSRWIDWATLLRRVFLVEVLVCSACGGERRPVQVVKEGPVARKILDHLALPTTVPRPSPWRPEPDLWDETGPPNDWDQRAPEIDWDQRTDSDHVA